MVTNKVALAAFVLLFLTMGVIALFFPEKLHGAQRAHLFEEFLKTPASLAITRVIGGLALVMAALLIALAIASALRSP